MPASSSSSLDLGWVRTTDALLLAARHVLNQSNCSSALREELQQWLSSQSEEGGEGTGEQDGPEYFNTEKSIHFDLVVKIHQELKVYPLG